MLTLTRPAWCAGSLGGKVALITGASSGIGEVVARELAKKGMKLVLLARRADRLSAIVEEIKREGGEAAFHECDVSDSARLQQGFALAEERYGGIDFVFANAGVEGGTFYKGLVDQDNEINKNMLDINVLGAIETLKYAVMSFEKRGGGTIAFSSSVAAFCGDACQTAMNGFGLPRGNVIAHSATKAALDIIAEGAHGSYHDKGVNVYNLNLAEYVSEMKTRLGGKQGSAPFNPFFKESLGNPIHIAEFIIATLDGTSKWPAGSAVVLDNDMTLHAKHLFARRKEPGSVETFGWPSPGELRSVAMDIRGNPYKFKDEL